VAPPVRPGAARRTHRISFRPDATSRPRGGRGSRRRVRNRIAAPCSSAAGAELLGANPTPHGRRARAASLIVEVARFRGVGRRRRTFDLVVSVQALHCSTPDRAPQGRRLVSDRAGDCVFWNYGTHERSASAACDARVCLQLRPRPGPCYALGTIHPARRRPAPHRGERKIRTVTTRTTIGNGGTRAPSGRQLPTHRTTGCSRRRSSRPVCCRWASPSTSSAAPARRTIGPTLIAARGLA